MIIHPKMSFSMKILLLPVVQIVCLLLYLSSLLLLPLLRPDSSARSPPLLSPRRCNLFRGRWVNDGSKRAMYDGSCPFHRNSWNCIKNGRENMEMMNSWRWIPNECDLPSIDPLEFMEKARDRRIGFVGDSLNENFLVAFLCILRVADPEAVKWKRRGAWRGAHFPRFNLTLAYHRAVLLSRYQWQPKQQQDGSGSKGSYRVEIDRPADEWVNITNFYDVLIFNTGHWWNHDKFPKETPLVFYLHGLPIHPPLKIEDGLKAVLENMVSFINSKFPKNTLKLWRLQSPRHFHGGEWNQNGSCLSSHPLNETQLDSWFDHNMGGVNGEARNVNRVVEGALHGSDIKAMDFTWLSEFRPDAHPAVWLGKKGAVSIWGQDCMHWCLPGVPDTWVDISSHLILSHFASSPTSSAPLV